MVYHPKTLQCLSVFQIVTAVISILLGIASAVVKSDFTSYAGFGIWVGLWILVTGLLGYFGSRDRNAPNNCLLGTFMGFAITACVLCGIMFICYCIALGILASALECHRARNSHYFMRHTYHNYNCHGTTYAGAKAGVGIGSVLLIIALTEFFIAMTSSIYCCNAVCCGARTVMATTQQQTVVFQQQQVLQPSSGVMIVSGSGGAVLQPPPGQFMIQQQAQPGFVTVGQPAYPPGYGPPAVYPPGYTTNTAPVAQPPPYSPAATNIQITHS